MTPFYSDDWLTLYGGDCREVLAGLPADSVDCVVTSPPYWGLRDYGTATWVGGDEACDHRPDAPSRAQRPSNGLTGGKSHVDAGTIRKGDCKCGATRIDSQLGLERTPEEYVANMVAVFAEVRRVLKPSGTCWLNLGDSYATSNPIGRRDADREYGRAETQPGSFDLNVRRNTGLKPKDLVGIPWRVAFALQADGWYLRSDIIWSKPNPMPESVTDRPTKSHEYLFLLTKSARYFFDADAVREQLVVPDGPWGGRTPRPGIDVNGGGQASEDGFRGYLANGGRNIRSVWNIATRPYPGAHFAVFPPELPERCIKAGSSERGVCPECGAPWERVREFTGELYMTPDMYGRPRSRVVTTDDYKTDGDSRKRRSVASGEPSGLATRVHKTTGWRPTCVHRGGSAGGDAYPTPLAQPLASPHETSVAPAVILDPFGGSGTVGMVANRLSRRAILIDLNPEYLKQQMTRNAQTPLGLTEGDAA